RKSSPHLAFHSDRDCASGRRGDHEKRHDICTAPVLRASFRFLGDHDMFSDAASQEQTFRLFPGMEHSMRQSVSTVVIEPAGRVPDLGLAELREYSELFFFLIWRDIKGRYAQSVLGLGWAIVQPVMAMIVFTVIFGNLAEIASDGVPYSIFSFTGLVAWTYYSNALTDSTGSLVINANMLQKIYFPRLILPLSAVLARMVDFTISLAILVIMMLWYGIAPTWWALGLPVLVLVLIISAAGMGMFLGAM